MQTGYSYNPAGGAYVPASQDNSVRPLPADHLPSGMQISIVAAQSPGELKVAYGPARCKQGHGQSQHFQVGKNFGIFANANPIRQYADSSGQQRYSSKHCLGEHLRNSSTLSNSTGPSGQLSTEIVLAVGAPKLYTDYEICEFVKQKVAAFASKDCPNDSDSPLQSHSNIPKSSTVTYHLTSSTCDNEDVEKQRLSCAVIEHCATASGQAVEEDSSKNSEANAELTPKSKDEHETSASERLSAEYPKIMNEAAVTCTKTEEGSPVVLTAMSRTSQDELTKNGSILGCSSSQEEYKSVWINADKGVGLPSVSSPLIHMTHKARGGKGLKPVEVNMQGVIHDPKDSWTPRLIGDQDENLNKQKNIGNQQHCPDTCGEAAAHSKLNSSVEKIQTYDAQSVSTNQSEQSVNHQTSCSSSDAILHPLPGRLGTDTPSVTILKEQQYEDISDAEDMSELDTKLPEHEDLHFSLRLEDPVYEDISEDENPPIQNTDVEMPSSPPDVSEPSVKQYGHVQVQVKSILDEKLIAMKQMTPKSQTPHVAQHCSFPHFGETDDDIECVTSAKCDYARQAGWQINCSYSPSSDLKDEDETDDEMDDDWDVIPLVISELKLVLPEDGADPEEALLDVDEHGDKVPQGGSSPTLCELRRPPPVQVPPSAFSQIEIFDTCESFQRAKALQFGIFPQFLSEESFPERDPKPHHSRKDWYSEPEDSCETDDSCNYSPVEERNHLTVSRKLLNHLSASASSETDDSESEKEDVIDEVTNLQNDQIRSRQSTHKKEDTGILTSDSEDECDQNSTNKAKRRRISSLQKAVSAAVPCSPPKRHSPDTVASVCESAEENLLKRRFPAAHSSKRTENIVRSKHVQHAVLPQNVSDAESVIVIDSDTDDDHSQNYKKAKRKKEFSLEWAGAGDDACVTQERTPVDTEYETAEEKLQERRPCTDSSKPQHGSERQDTLSEKEMQDASFDLSNSVKRRELSEARTGSMHVHQKTNTRMTSKCFHESDQVVTKDHTLKKKAKTKRRTPSSEAEDSDLTFGNAQRSPYVNNKPQKTVQSAKDSSKKPPQSGRDRDEDSTLGSNPVVARLSFDNFPQCSEHLKLKNYKAHGRDEDETPKKPTSTSKNVDSCKTKTQPLHKDRQGTCFSKPTPGNDTNHVTPASKSKESSSHPRKRFSLSKLQRPRSYDMPSTFTNPYSPTTGPSAMTLVTNKWRDSYFSTRKDKKTSVGTEEGLRSTNNPDLLKEAKPGRSQRRRAPRRRNSTQESATPLMKKTMDEAREWTKARNRDSSSEQTDHRVGKGYKWRK
ncbi:uncharacterized protein LOC103372291 isoform X2 [Stegastes partitus]|uniref:Uncharacterized protein LOC103372291 isoform X2 n=1 Tax=Stegastes partitus TaxID=144197 RepID=A0A9Y4U0F5_9TELE|nr:PREDICTED: uncharacterized protein LOC103372291 isoform X2 [Stegastes partitus]